MPHDWTASLIAIDGSTAADLPDQLAEMPADATHVVVSIGGNDALLPDTTLITADERYLRAARAKGRIVHLMEWR
jgi:hypothetical protein